MVGTAAMVLLADCAHRREFLEVEKGGDKILRTASGKATRKERYGTSSAALKSHALVSADEMKWMPNEHKMLVSGAWQYVIYSQHHGTLKDSLVACGIPV